MAAIDLGTNGEVMVTDGTAYPGRLNGRRACIRGGQHLLWHPRRGWRHRRVTVNEDEGSLDLATIGDHPPVGLTGSGLLDLICELRRAGVIERSGRFAKRSRRLRTPAGHRTTRACADS